MVLSGWVWVPMKEGGRALAFAYTDPSAGPSARGARVEEPLTSLSLRRVLDWPDRIFRRPSDFGATLLPADEVQRLGLPGEPPWFFVFSGKDEPMDEGEAVRRVAGLVLRDGEPVAGVRVDLGDGGVAANFSRLATRTTDDEGGFLFAKVPTRAGFLIATHGELGTAPLAVSGEGPSTLDLQRLGRLEGQLLRDGKPATGLVRLLSEDKSRMERLERSGPDGHFCLDHLVPGDYTLVVCRSGRECMNYGPPIVEKITVNEGEVVHRSYTLGVGAQLGVEIVCDDAEASAMITLVAGHFVPRDNKEIRHLWRLPGMRYSTMRGRVGNLVTTVFDDVLLGPYTLCIVRDLMGQYAPDSAQVAWRHLTFGDESQIVRLDMPPW
jgi:hypothetical protein